MTQNMQIMKHCPIKWMESETTPPGAQHLSISLSNTRTHIHLETLAAAIWQYFAKLRGTYANFGNYWIYISCLNWFIYQNSFISFALILYFVQQMTWFNNKSAQLKKWVCYSAYSTSRRKTNNQNILGTGSLSTWGLIISNTIAQAW